jgi:hypothetical protein
MCDCKPNRPCGAHECPDCGGRVTFYFLHVCRPVNVIAGVW